MPNRLAASTSPYLRQHADNPVDWWEWGADALAEARRRDVPVLLSVGYAACHWCHVMAHESFEDESVAALMNEHFVNVKVDREERPDVDAVYMNATQAMTGHGGWPMTCFLTPDGEPFHCGTYYPPQPRQGMPSFPQLIEAIARTWAERADEVRASAADVTAQLAKQGWKLTPAPVGPDELAKAVRLLGTQFDSERGGFGSAPKFPPSMTLEFLLRHVERTGSQAALDMATATFEPMARGGMYDQLGGGFARYSVDAEWVVPHFEKMLYDNALLLRAYAHWARLPDAPPLARRVAEETAEFLLRDLRTADGGFASSLDADAAGSEGSTYVWTPAQLADALGDDDARFAAMVFDVTTRGTFEHGASVLQLRADPPDLDRFLAVRSGLLALRALRPQPPRDDKVVTAWNGLAITALAEAGAALGHASWIAAAIDAATLLFDVHVVDGRLRRSSRDGVVGPALAVLDDHASFAHGLLALHQATADPGWLDAACWLLDITLDRFAADEPGSFHDTADDAEPLFARPRDPADNASPSGASALAEALLTASALTGSARYREAADAALAAVGSLARQAPRFAGHWLTVAEAVAHGPLQVAVSASGSLASSGSLLAVARAAAPGGAVVLGGAPDTEGLPLLADRPLQGGAPTAYVCRGFVCDRPVTTADELIALLRPTA